MDVSAIYVVDDEEQIRVSIAFLLRAFGEVNVQPFSSGEEFLKSAPRLSPGCVLLDIHMPGTDGIEVLGKLQAYRDKFAPIMMSGTDCVSTAVDAMRLGAMEFLQKPFDNDLLMAAITQCRKVVSDRQREARKDAGLRRLVEALQPREMEVLRGLVAGMANKQISALIGISTRTVEIYRGRMMARLGVESLAQAVIIALQAGLQPLVEQTAKYGSAARAPAFPQLGHRSGSVSAGDDEAIATFLTRESRAD